MTDTLTGDIDHIDHSVLMTRDIETTAATYEALGFTLSPLSRHHGTATPGGRREPMGAGNRCAYFGRSYLEILGVFFDGSRDPWNVRPLVEAHAGLRGVVLGAADCEVTQARLASAGVPVSGVMPLQREVETPDGVATARFRSVHVAREATPEGEVLIGQQLTPELVHQPRFLGHPNGAVGLVAMLLVVADDELPAHVDRWARLTGRVPHRRGTHHVVPLDDGRLDIAPQSGLGELLPGETAPLLPVLAGQTVEVGDLELTRRLVTDAGFTVHDLDPRVSDDAPGVLVPAAEAAGAAVVFTARRS